MRKHLFLFLGIICQCTFVFAQSTDKRFNGIDTFVNRVLKEWHAAGCAVAVVDHNKVIFSHGFGYKDYTQKIPVTDNTLFAIGSCSKAFTASLLGMLVKDGKLDLDPKQQEIV